MGRYLLTDLAKADIRDIAAFVRKGSPRYSIIVRSKLQDQMRLIADSPGIGHMHQELADSLRVWRVYDWLIIYRPDTKPVQVLRVLHGARDLGKFFPK